MLDSQGQDVALTIVYVAYSLDIGNSNVSLPESRHVQMYHPSSCIKRQPRLRQRAMVCERDKERQRERERGSERESVCVREREAEREGAKHHDGGVTSSITSSMKPGTSPSADLPRDLAGPRENGENRELLAP